MRPDQRAFYSKISQYMAWIARRMDLESHGYGYGKCKEISQAMAEAFPELEVRKGFYHCASWGRRTHFWCRFLHGIEGEEDPWQIVDPTGKQHPSGSHFPNQAFRYEDLTDCSEGELLDRVPSSVCMNCGAPVYRTDQFCSPGCEDAVVAEFNRPSGTLSEIGD